MVPGICEKSGGVTSTILSDRMGSMKGLSNAGTVTDTAEFDAFGKVVSRTGTNTTQKGFVGAAGYQEDGESGYKLLGHRYYDADTGRFLSRDPLRADRNWYAYCDNNPLKHIDPTGLDWHNPGQVWVDPRFKGEVWAMGEPGPGKKQYIVKVKPGQMTHPGMDVDLVVICKPDGTKQAWLLLGHGYLTIAGRLGHGDPSGFLEPEHYWVDENGELHCESYLDSLFAIPVDLESGLGMADLDQKRRVDEAKKRGSPGNRIPFMSPRPAWAGG